MRSRFAFLTPLALLVSPTVALAEPIQFELTRTGFWVQPDQASLVAGLYTTFDGGSFVVDPATGNATPVGPMVSFDPSRLPTPAPIDLHPDGSRTDWHQVGLFRVDLRLTDVGSGQFADLSIFGNAHADSYYYQGNWYGSATYWFGDDLLEHATLGGHDYVLWGQQAFTGAEPTVSVWVGPNPPVPWVPEPSTLLLAGLGLIPLGRRLVLRR